MIEDDNNKQVLMSKGEPLKKEEILRDENDKQVCTITVDPLNQKEMSRDEKVKQVRTYASILSTGRLSNERER